MYYYYYYAVRRPLSREYGIAVPAFASHAALSLALTFFFFFSCAVSVSMPNHFSPSSCLFLVLFLNSFFFSYSITRPGPHEDLA